MSYPNTKVRAPYPTDVEAGKTYVWCACGLSSRQPLCDGSHKSAGMTPIRWTAPRSEKVYFCGCKVSVNKPICDGTHGKLP